MTSRQDPDHHIRNLKFDFEATKIVAFEDPESEMKEYYWLAPHLLDQLKHHRRNYFGGPSARQENFPMSFFSGEIQDPTFKLNNNSNQLLLTQHPQEQFNFLLPF